MPDSHFLPSPSRVGAASLVIMAQRLAAKFVDSIQSFADAPAHLVQPILKKVTSAEQLRVLEEESPQIIGTTTIELWKFFIKRDIPSGNHEHLEPKNPASWGKLYRKLKREDEARQKAAEEQLRESLGQHQAKRESNKATILRTVLPGRIEPGAFREAGVTARNAGQNALNALRRQTGRNSTSKLTRPIRGAPSLATRPRPNGPAPVGTVTQAPQSMIQQYARQGVLAPRPAVTRPRPAAPAVLRPRMGIRNPFRSGGSNMPVVQQQALSLALQLEESTKRAKEAEKRKVAATAHSQPSRPTVSTSPSTKTVTGADATRPSTSAERRHPVEASKAQPPTPRARAQVEDTALSPVKPQASEAAQPATEHPKPAQQVVKRKAPNIFMAPKRPRR
ncbi:hypothetical protein ANO11243_037290 [Dothideomycetidae sp. 11243]|nr:hypothetical protein ANO11243_037290 [fungal sp. No.11243]